MVFLILQKLWGNVPTSIQFYIIYFYDNCNISLPDRYAVPKQENSKFHSAVKSFLNEDGVLKPNSLMVSTKYRITSFLKVETDIITSISANPIGWAGIFVIMSVKSFRTDVFVFIGDITMWFTSDWPINLHMWVANGPNIIVDQGQFNNPDFISRMHQRENVQFEDNN